MSGVIVGKQMRNLETGEVVRISAISSFMVSYQNEEVEGEVRADALHSLFEVIDEVLP